MPVAAECECDITQSNSNEMHAEVCNQAWLCVQECSRIKGPRRGCVTTSVVSVLRDSLGSTVTYS
jgi:hypothetical protein